MDRLNQLRGEAGGSRDTTLDTSSPPSEAFMTANESSSKYFSLSEVDSTFDISPIKDVSLASTNMDSEKRLSESDQLMSNLSPIGAKSDFLDTYKIGKQIEAANILSGGVAIFDDNDNSYDGDELVIDEVEDKSNPELKLELDDNISEAALEQEAVGSKDTEVILQIDGKNVDAIDIGNGLYLYRKEGQEELAAVQIIDDDQQQPNFKFLKVRENAEGNLEVYEEIQIEVPKEVPVREEKVFDKNIHHRNIKDINKVISESTSNIIADKKIKSQSVVKPPVAVIKEPESEHKKETQPESKLDGNETKKIKFSESRKSPVIGSFTPMAFHSTPNKEPIPLTKTMVDQQLHPNRHSDNNKKTIEVHTDISKQKIPESPVKLIKDIDNEQIQQAPLEKILAEDKNELLQPEQDCKEVINEITHETEKEEQKTKWEKIDKQNEIHDKEKELATTNNLEILKITQVETENESPNVKEDIREIKSLTSEVKETKKIPSSKNPDLEVSPNENIGKQNDSKTTVGYKTDLEDANLCPVVPETSNVSRDQKSTEKPGIEELIPNQQGTKSDAPKDYKEEQMLQSKEENENKTTVAIAKLQQDAEIPNKDSAASIQSLCNEPIKSVTDTLISKLPESSHMDNTKTSFNDMVAQEVSTDLSDSSKNKSEVSMITTAVEDNTQKNKSSINDYDTSKKENKIVVADIESAKDKNKDQEIEKNTETETSAEIKNPNKEKSATIKTFVEISKPNSETKVDPSCESNKPIKAHEIKKTEEIKKNDENTIEHIIVRPVQDQEIKLTNKDQEKKATDYEPKLDTNLRVNSMHNVLNEKVLKSTQAVNKKKMNIVPERPAKSVNVVKTIATSDNLLPSKIMPQVPIHVAEVAEMKNLDIKPVILHNAQHTKTNTTDRKVLPKMTANSDQKPINNNHAPVPFGKWTEVNRQAFLNKIKESKVPTNSSNGKQIKNSNDLNRRDVLKKIDSQRQSSIATAKALELANVNKLIVKNETAFVSKSSVQKDSKTAVKTEVPILKNTNPVLSKKIAKQEMATKPQTITTNTETFAVKKETSHKKESTQRKEINNQDLIDKTIEGIINRAVPVKAPSEEASQNSVKDAQNVPKSDKSQPLTQASLDEIEMKMNELHGIPFIERPPHELPYVPKPTPKATTKLEIQKPSAKPSKIPNLLPFVNKNIQKGVKENIVDVDSEEEIIEHEPITGDMDLTKKSLTKHMAEKAPIVETLTLISADSSKKETIITENDFDKFVRRNSISYEDCLTVNYDGTEPLHNLVQTIVQKDTGLTIYAKAESVQSITKLESPRKLEFSQNSAAINSDRNVTKYEAPNNEDDGNKNYQSKVKIAYQTAMTAKRQLERPITIIDDKPVKVVFTDSNIEFISSQLNIQSKPSPTKKTVVDIVTTQVSDSLDSDTLDSIDETKISDDVKLKTKHQRKQVLTPVDTPELELIEPDDLGIEVSPKKKRRTEEKVEKISKTLVPKKSYLLGRGNTTDEYISKPFDLSKTPTQSSSQESSVVSHKNAASAIDSLVKAAELLETQSGNITSKSSDVSITDSQLNTPVKRGRGRPRKNPLPDGETDRSKVPSPQKKPRLIDAKVVKNKETDEDDDHDDDYDDDNDSIDSAMVKENWTMGKINENIVCPICNKLFRSENVVFKHVKHCTGLSPSRSDSENKSPRRLRDSQGSETKSYESKSDIDIDEADTESLRKNVRQKRKSKETCSKEIIVNKDELIVIEDTPIEPKLDKRDESKLTDSRKSVTSTAKNKGLEKTSSLVCEFCGKTFRQLSYLVNHKLQHGKEDTKKDEGESTKVAKTIFGCEICKKEFRKLHHLVQHRVIHYPSTVKVSRKSSSEQGDSKSTKDRNSAKQSDDASAGFRCEPCDKSFRKLHHLVEHRETHDVIINKQKTLAVVPTNSEKQQPPPPQCEVCKKTFRKLHHLIEHKEQHIETSSEKSDDKSIKSSLSTKDIIHECSRCYMVFPNEHSLNKHTVICQRKKRQSATKQIKQTDEDGNKETEVDNESNINKETLKGEENKTDEEDDVTIVSEEIAVDAKPEQQDVKEATQPKPEQHQKKNVEMSLVVEDTIKSVEPKVQVKESLKSDHEDEKSDDEVIADLIKSRSKLEEDLHLKAKQIVDKESKPKIPNTPRKTKTPLKDKVAPTVTKRHRPNLPLPDIDQVKPAESDDDEVRYMLNPDYKLEDNEGKLFMKVRASKRDSLQIERPNSKDLVKRRISLQHPPKIPRLKPKPLQVKAAINKAINTKPITRTPKLESVPSTDSDDSDVKYSFPERPPEKSLKVSQSEKASKEPIQKTQRKSLAEKRKSLSIIAKKKSLGQAVGAKLKAKQSPLKPVRKRTADIEHRCDCGQLFSSAALLARHASLAHTPPRRRRPRSPPAAPPPPPPGIANPRTTTKRKSSVKTEPKTPTDNRNSPKSSDKTDTVKSATSNVKLRRYTAHKGVPVPEKMRKLMEKSKK